ncbi:MAG: hypothetical protein KDA60_19180 [Planctomycetales bacterium]|nr:hypothetical protein [Planctomycetales bacterium]
MAGLSVTVTKAANQLMRMANDYTPGVEIETGRTIPVGPTIVFARLGVLFHAKPRRRQVEVMT